MSYTALVKRIRIILQDFRKSVLITNFAAKLFTAVGVLGCGVPIFPQFGFVFQLIDLSISVSH